MDLDQARERADAGDHAAHWALPELLVSHGKFDELRDRALAGDKLCEWRWVDLLALLRRADDLREWARAGNKSAARALARITADPVLLDELRATDSDGAVAELVAILLDHGRVDELRVLAETDRRRAGWALPKALAAAGLTEELRALGDAGDHEAHRLYIESLHHQSAERELRRRADADERWALVSLVSLYERRGDEAAIEALAGAGHAFAAKVLAERRDVDRLRAVADQALPLTSGPHTAYLRLLVRLGREDELRARAELNEGYAVEQLGWFLKSAGRLDEFVEFVDRTGFGRHVLAGMLESDKRLEDLATRAKAGDWFAGSRLWRRICPPYDSNPENRIRP